MIFEDITGGTAIFLDTNTLVYHFSSHPTYGDACTKLLERIERQEIQGYTSALVIHEMAHRLMTIEACSRFGWPTQGIANRLRRHPAEVQLLTRYKQAIDELGLFHLQYLLTTPALVSLAADVSRQTGLLSADALIVSTMRDRGLTHLASLDRDFDRVPGIARYEPT